jgi:hypothetical protein
MTEPLKWCLDWDHLTFREKLLMGAPFVATEDQAYRDVVRQLKKRTEVAMEEWAKYPQEVSQLAKSVSQALKSDGIWPSEAFVPDDPADIPFALRFDFTDKWDLMPYSIDLVEKRLGIKMQTNFWDRLNTMSFAEAIAEICRREAEQTAGQGPGTAGAEQGQ